MLFFWAKTLSQALRGCPLLLWSIDSLNSIWWWRRAHSRSAKKKTFPDLEHSRLAGNTATFTAVITSESSTCVQNMVWIEVC